MSGEASIKDAIDNINSVRESIRSAKGQKYLCVVEIMAGIMKRKELMQKMMLPIMAAVNAPKELVELITHLNADIDARTVTIALMLAELDPGPGNGLAKEILEWGERLNSIESDSILATMPKEVRDFITGRKDENGKGLG
jgi:hypothetical protein